MVWKLMLHFVYELNRFDCSIPWNEIGHRLHPGFSGNALRQKLDRVRKELIAEGHLVPPEPSHPLDGDGEEFRGLIRANVNPRDRDFTTVRIVKWEEPLLDRDCNLPDAKTFVHNRAIRGKSEIQNIPDPASEAEHTIVASDEEGAEVYMDDEVEQQKVEKRFGLEIKQEVCFVSPNFTCFSLTRKRS